MTKTYITNNQQVTMKGITFGFLGASVFFIALSIKFFANSEFVPAGLLCFLGLGMIAMAVFNHQQRVQEVSIASGPSQRQIEQHDAQLHTQILDLSASYAKGENRYIVGNGDTGKTTYIFGIIINTLSHRSRTNYGKYTNVVVVDSGRSYESLSNILADSQFIEFQAVNDLELAPVTLSNKSFSVFELEELKRFKENPFSSQIIDSLKKVTTKDTLLIIDEWWMMPPQLKQWALTEFEGETLVSIMAEEDITADSAFHLFDGSTELSKLNHKRSRARRL